jgi:flavin reductase (DIM6/NTAB) family NADH-FMN oxidoreductase RutF
MAENKNQATQAAAEVADTFKVAMSRLAAGVVMVTCHVDEKPWGLTVSACCSVSMDPPLILVSLGKETTSAYAIAETGRFGVSLLGESLIKVAQFGAARGQAKFMDEEFCRIGDHACATPVVAGALAAIDCTVERTVPAGDHTIYLGAVNNVLVREDDSPLVYYSRSYHQLSEVTDLHVSPEKVSDETVDSLLYDYPVPRTFARGIPLGL